MNDKEIAAKAKEIADKVLENQEPVEEGVVKSPQEAFEVMQGLLGIIEPTATIVVLDVTGGTHEVRTVLPARRQIKVLRFVEQAVSEAWSIKTSVPAGLPTSQVLLQVIRGATENDEVLELVGSAFDAAYPGAVKKAAENYLNMYPSEEAPTLSLDLFAVEDLVEGLLPLLSRSAGKILEMVKGIQDRTMKSKA